MVQIHLQLIIPKKYSAILSKTLVQFRKLNLVVVVAAVVIILVVIVDEPLVIVDFSI